MSSPYDPLAGLDVDEQLRRRQLLQNMFGAPQDQTDTTVSFGQQPQTQPAQITPWQQPPVQQPPNQQPSIPQFDPQTLQNIQKNLPFGQPQIPSPTDVTQAGTNLSKIAGQQVTPGQYPRSKVLTALVAPLMLKQFLRDPRQATENLNILTRRGYGAAEEEHARNLEAAKTDYTVKQQIFKDQLSTATEGIKGNNEFITQQMRLMELGIKTPLDIQKSTAELQRINLEIAKLKAGEVMTGEPWHLTVDGKSVVGFPTKGPDGLGWVDANNEKLKGNIAPINKVASGTGSEFSQRVDTILSALDHPATPKERQAAENQARKDMQAPAEQRQAEREQAAEARQAERETAATTRQATQEANIEFRGIQRANQETIGKIEIPILQQHEKIRSLKDAARAGNWSSVARAMEPVELITATGTAMGNINRFNQPEVRQIIEAAGGWENFKQNVQYYIGKTGKVPKWLSDEIIKFADVMDKQLGKEEAMLGKYRTENNSLTPTGREKANSLIQRMGSEMIPPEAPKTREEMLRDRGIIK